MSIAKIILFIIVIPLIAGCKSASYPEAMSGSSQEALMNRIHLYLMYQFNNTPVAEQKPVSKIEIRGPYAGGYKVRLIRSSMVGEVFDIKITDFTTSNAIVHIDSNKPELFNWGEPAGASIAQEWVLIDGNWFYKGNPDPFYGW